MYLNCCLEFPSYRINAQCTGYTLHISWGIVCAWLQREKMRAGTGKLVGPRDLFYPCSWAIVSNAAFLGAACAFIPAADIVSACQNPTLKHWLAQDPSKPPYAALYVTYTHEKNTPRSHKHFGYSVFELWAYLGLECSITDFMIKSCHQFEITWWELQWCKTEWPQFCCYWGLEVVKVELRKLLIQLHSWYFLRNQQAVHVHKAWQKLNISALV